MKFIVITSLLLVSLLNPVQHDRTKYVEVDKHFIKEELDNGLICTPFVSTNNQISDILSKGLSNKFFEHLLFKMVIENIHSPNMNGKYPLQSNVKL